VEFLLILAVVGGALLAEIDACHATWNELSPIRSATSPSRHGT